MAQHIGGKFTYGAIAAIILVVLLLSINSKYFQPQTIMAKVESDYMNELHIKWVTSKISDEFLPFSFVKPQNPEFIVRQRARLVDIIEDKTHRLTFVSQNELPSEVIVSIAPFPAWQVYVDGARWQHGHGSNSIVIGLAQGRHEVAVVYESTSAQRAGNILSLISIISILGGILLVHAGHRTRFLFGGIWKK